jgi:hypothetical protein
MRIWGKGLEAEETYCFDFVNSNGHPVNTPQGWKIVTVPGVDDIIPSQAVLSVEAAFGVKARDLCAGEEKYVVPEGLCCRISIPNQRSVTVTIPRRAHPAVAV